MSILKEFKEFAMRGSMVDLAVGIIIGGGFGKIVSSLVADIIMPPLGLLIGGVSFTDIKFMLKEAVLDASGKIITPATTLNIGNFVQAIFDFTIIAFSIFMIIKLMNNMKKKSEKEEIAAPPPPPSNQEVLLTEIRDLLKK